MRWVVAILALLFVVLFAAAIWQYTPEARERAEIRKVVKDYLAQQFYKNPQILDIRIYRSYALAVAYDLETLILFLQKRKGQVGSGHSRQPTHPGDNPHESKGRA